MNPVKVFDKTRYPPTGWTRRLVWLPPCDCTCKHPDATKCTELRLNRFGDVIPCNCRCHVGKAGKKERG